MAWMVPAVAWVMGPGGKSGSFLCWTEPARAARDVCRRAIAPVSRHARRHSLGGRQIVSGWLVPTLYRCRALV